MTYIGDINELTHIVDSFSHYPGFKRLESGIKSNDWEQFELAFAVAIEVYCVHIRENLNRYLTVEYNNKS